MREDEKEKNSQHVLNFSGGSFRNFSFVHLSGEAQPTQPGACEGSISPAEPGTEHFMSTYRAFTCGRMQKENMTLVMTAWLAGGQTVAGSNIPSKGKVLPKVLWSGKDGFLHQLSWLVVCLTLIAGEFWIRFFIFWASVPTAVKCGIIVVHKVAIEWY